MSYLTRLQIYRALDSITESQFTTTNANLVFKPYSSNSERWAPAEEVAATDDLFGPQGTENRFWDGNWGHRWLGRDNGDWQAGTSALASTIGDIGDNNTAQRTDWAGLLGESYSLLDELQGSSLDDPGSYPNPANLDPLDTEIYPAGSALEFHVKDHLFSFRNFYTGGQSQAKKDEYYDIAYAWSAARAQQIIPGPGWEDNASEFVNLLRRGPNGALSDHEPVSFTLHKGQISILYPNQQQHFYGEEKRYIATRLVIRIFAVHNALYGTAFYPLGTTPGLFTRVAVNRALYGAMLENISAGFAILVDDIKAWQESIDERLAAYRDQQEDLGDIALEEIDFSVHELTDSEIYSISIKQEYNEYFTTTFNQDIIATVPIIHNLYLTEQHFEDISRVMLAPKIRALDTLITIITEDGDFDMSPRTARPASRQAIAAANGDRDFGPFLQELIIKILIETPINILKSLCELIDPHIAITKLIKTGSMHAFAQGAKAIDASPVPEQINTHLSELLPDADIKLTGEDLMGVLVCLIEAGFTAGDMGIEAAMDGDSPSVPNFFPTATYKGGIDFTGTVSGMIMAPPLPFGLIYLLLELIKSKLNQQTVNLDTPPRDPGCEDEEEGDNL